jgi:hypothetical protein
MAGSAPSKTYRNYVERENNVTNTKETKNNSKG